MRTSTYITVLTIAALTLTACESEVDQPANGLRPGQVDIQATITSSHRPDTSPDSRATIDKETGEGTFAPGDTWGMYATTASETKLANSIYTVGTTALFWSDLSTTRQVTFSAHYPRITKTINDPTAYEYNLIEQNAAAHDLLAATATASKGDPVQLEFHHLMHRLIVNLKSGANMDGVDLSQAVIKTISAAGKPTVAFSTYVNLITGTVGTAQEPDGVYYSATGTKADMIVVPQDLTPYEGFLKIVIDGDTWHYNVPATLNPSNKEHPTRLESGQCLTLTLTLKKSPPAKTEVELTSSEISGWNDQDAVNSDVEAEIPHIPGTIDMTKMTADEAQAAIKKDLEAGVTAFKLTGPLEKSGIGKDASFSSTGDNPFANSNVTSIDLTGVTDWPNVDADNDGSTDDGIGIPAYSFLENNNGTNIYPSLAEVKLPADVKTIGLYAFTNNKSLTTVSMDKLKVIGTYAFLGCNALKAVNLPEVTDIMADAFYECAELTTVNITTTNADAIAIGYEAFYNCAKLETVNASTVTSISSSAFYGCSQLTTATLTVAKSIGSYVFYNCSALQKLDLPAATEFGSYFLRSCTGLTELSLTAAGNFVNVGGTDPLQSTDCAFEGLPAKNCSLTLNADKKQSTGSSAPQVASDGKWCWGNDNEEGKAKQPLSWKSISYLGE